MRTPAIATALLLLPACGVDRVVYSDPGADGNLAPLLDPTVPDRDEVGDLGPTCPELPPDRPLVPGLRTGWAVDGSEGTLLQLGSHAFDCSAAIEQLFTDAEACPEVWALELYLPPLEPGDIELSAEHPGVVVHLDRSADGSGCARDTIHSATQGFSGLLRILDMNDECIVGELVDLTLPSDDLPELSGVFVAERC